MSAFTHRLVLDYNTAYGLDTYFINGNIQVNKISPQRFPLPTVQDKLCIKEMHAFNLLLACFQS